MRDVSKKLFKYLDAKQHVWNCYFLELFNSLEECEPLDSFNVICERLFYVIVANDLGIQLPRTFKLGHDYIEKILVTAQPFLKNLPVFISDKTDSQRGNSFSDASLNVTGTTLFFVDFFQWKNYSFLSASLVRCKVAECVGDPTYVGRDVLIQIEYVNFFFNEPAQ